MEGCFFLLGMEKRGVQIRVRDGKKQVKWRVNLMELDKVIGLLEEEYAKARKLKWVKNPLAWALYRVWKKADAEGCGKREEKAVALMCERLIELLVSAPRKDVIFAGTKVGTAVDFPYMADYLLANGVIVPPCKVGDKVYYLASNLHTKVTKIRTGTVTRIAITEDGIDLFADNWAAKLPYGKRSFLTKEEAEAALTF